MRLSKIKLAGFKSFVDPTTFQLPSNLVGIVGPNGCGKSNVIDAVRWVMGEMSAKHLRGDSMADVIFNGSATRKPVGTASIELFFDNSDGSIGGQYAQYAEISLKRMISRDGTSSYFLNNTRCRRKDITDLFLGTGLGSRSYAIIEQGMVSRLVDAKPDDMRTYIEEAAGISKYKERRRETETRIQHTRDNLARLNDLREEITKQLEYLQRQARTAERYKEHRARERRLEAELLVIRLTELDGALENGRRDFSRRETELEAAIAEQRRLENAIVAARERHVASTEAFNGVQAQHYAVQSEISRLEQAIAHAREIRDRQHADHRQAQEQLASIDAEISRDAARLDEMNASLARLEPELSSARQAESAAAATLRGVEEALESWQNLWHEYNLGIKELQQSAQVEQTRVEHLTDQVNQLRRQQESLDRDRGAIVMDELSERLARQAQAEQASERRTIELNERIAALDAEATELRSRERQLGQDLERLTAELASRQGQAAALRAMQEAALGAEDATLGGWLAREHLDGRPRLAQRLRAEERWVLAVETVLGEFLQGVCIDDSSRYLVSLPDTQVILVEETERPAAAEARSLLSRVASPGHAAQILRAVFTAESLEEAIAIRAGLTDGQSVVTPDGIWLGPGWVRVNKGQRSAAGLLSREQQLRELQETIARDERGIAEIDDARHSARSRIEAVQQERAQAIQEFNGANREHAESLAVLDNLRLELGRARERSHALERDIGHVTGEIDRLKNALAEAGGRAAAARAELDVQAARRGELQSRQEELLAAYGQARERAEHERACVTRINVEFESRRVARDSAEQSLTRLQSQRSQVEERALSLHEQISSAEPAIAGMQSELGVHLGRKLEVDQALAARRGELEEVESGLRSNESLRSSTEKAVAAARELVDGLRLQVREVEIRRESVMEAFAANGASLDDVRSGLPPDAEATRWQESLDDVRRKIERLGPINLAAIEQFNEQSERKKYLDAQNDDLSAALDTLEQAIRKIDRETRARFQETFDNVNQGLKRIFPRLFGGGHAYLSLEGEDILAAGVTVMARPPGKRNSHIHLLSGGEKALTAVALIFSIFELNPAPFCLLDEVDAPLDEANVGRFCDIVREMSQRVQFVVITHNKTTMEMANQLTGVTMNEPGVSRLVSVDLDAAVQLAAS